ncbi:alcohol dehydrogenase 1-like [Drosophila tropicalis]|uniref:alcohol dehydrogenase 1-like n=1 Tax=Drosophila tropicalis TaxID=46794 RepID=UPI0035AC0C8A
MNLTGKNVIYFGGFGGIGQKCIPELLGKQLKALAIFDLTENTKILDEWQKKFPNTEIFHQKVDVTKKSDIEAAYKAASQRLEFFDVIVNGSGIMNDRLIELSVDINLMGVINSTLTALEYMDKSKKGRGGLIVNISSVVGLQPSPLFPVYAASKTAVTCFTRSLGVPFYYERFGVSFITICPGMTDTGLLDDMSSKTIFDFETPLNKIAAKIKRQKAEDCARNLVKAIEEGKNGDVLMLELGTITEVKIPIHWVHQFDD